MKKELEFEQFNKREPMDADERNSIRRREVAEKARVTYGTVERYEEEMGIPITKEFLGENVLDLGSGFSADFPKEAAKKGIKVYSLSESLSRKAVRDILKTSLKPSGKTLKDIPFTGGLAQELPFKSNVFDSVVSSYAIPMYLEAKKEEYELAFREIVRVLKAGRKAYLCPKYSGRIDPEILEKLKKDFKKQKFADIDLETGDTIIMTKPKERER